MSVSARLERSEREKIVAGVCGGLAEHLRIDVTLVRLAFVIATIAWGVGILAYLVLLVIMPLPGGTSPLENGLSEKGGIERLDGRTTAGVILIALGLLFLLDQSGYFRFVQWRYIWPLAVIAFGVFVLLRRARP